MALIDIDYFKRLPLGSKAIGGLSAEVIEETIQEASDYVEDYIDRKVLATQYIERIPGQRNYTIILDNYPITALADVSWVDVLGNQGTHSLTDFLVHAESGILEYIDKRDNFRGDRVYVITYTAGYATVPSVIRRAVALQTVQLLQPMFGGPNTQSELVPFSDELIGSLLEKYRRKRLS